ncbi:MAG TPA: hypothetical protein VGO40_20625 [Longimicrobium sp.]|jgi:hypothetical protein|nr:hypothetical protein [Longimicrobium sp.]
MKKKLKKAMKKRLRKLVRKHGAEVAATLVTGFLTGLAAARGSSARAVHRESLQRARAALRTHPDVPGAAAGVTIS